MLSVEAREIDGIQLSPLMDAIYDKDTDKLSAMLNDEVDPNEKIERGLTPLALALATSNIEAVKMLLEHGAKQEVFDTVSPLDMALSQEIQSNSRQLVKLLIAHGLPREHIKEYGIMPSLMTAIAHKDAQVVDLLIKHGASVNIESKSGHTPLMMAVTFRQYDIVKSLFEAGAKAKNKSLLLAHSLSDPKILQLVIDNGIEPNAYVPIGEYKESFIKIAFNVGNPDSIKVLLENGMDVNIATQKGITPLIFATQQENADLVRFFLRKGADPKLKDTFGRTALNYAIINNNPEIEKILKFWFL